MITSSLRNPNIVPLVGYCIDPEKGLFLVYKYISGGSLEYHLHDTKKGGRRNSTIPWSVRYKVALGIAPAINYLHNGTERCVKPSNILLSTKKIPKLCDFGLATWTSAPSMPFFAILSRELLVYLVPEYFQHGKVSDKTNVYAFGVVLLELLTGRKPIEARRPVGEENLVIWAKPLLQKGKGGIGELLDPGIKCTLRNTTQIIQMIQAAIACVSSEESLKPGIREISLILRGEEEPLYTSRKKSSYSGIIDYYNQHQQTKSEMNSHLALAMLGVSKFEDDDHLYHR